MVVPLCRTRYFPNGAPCISMKVAQHAKAISGHIFESIEHIYWRKWTSISCLCKLISGSGIRNGIRRKQLMWLWLCPKFWGKSTNTSNTHWLTCSICCIFVYPVCNKPSQSYIPKQNGLPLQFIFSFLGRLSVGTDQNASLCQWIDVKPIRATKCVTWYWETHASWGSFWSDFK